jgi:hypothetical protein
MAEGDDIASSRYCVIKGTIANNPAPIGKKAADEITGSIAWTLME